MRIILGDSWDYIADAYACVRIMRIEDTSGVGRGGGRGLDAGSSPRVPVRVRIYFPVSRRSKPYGHDC